MEFFLIAAAGSVADRLYMIVFKEPIQRGPSFPQLFTAILCGIGGAAGALAVSQLTGQNNLFTAVVGAFIGGRLVGGAIDLARSPARE